jgi:hypothetical protein
VAAEREVILRPPREVGAARTTTTIMENLAKKYLSGDEVVDVKVNPYYTFRQL